MSAIITEIISGSLANQNGIAVGESLLSINGHVIHDVMDYKFYSYDEEIDVLIENPKSGRRHVLISKDFGEDLGLSFETYLMDKPKTCANKCIFCFIDQMPKGMRPSLYFKDDDARLSFLLGNYVTLTNMPDRDIDRIIQMHISPIRISVHATEPELRALMLGNPRGRFGYEIMKRFKEAGIQMECQIVLCPGYNDGEHLIRTLNDLEDLYPNVSSVSIVPIGLTKYRDGLTQIEPVDEIKAKEIIKIVEDKAETCYKKWNQHIFYCSDEFYLKAGYKFHEADYYEGFEQLENGIGMIPLFKEEFYSALKFYDEGPKNQINLTIATGYAAKDMLDELSSSISKRFPRIKIDVYAIKNHFFGEKITVSGLIVGKDLIAQLKEKQVSKYLLLPENMLRQGENVFLDDLTTDDVEKALNCKVIVTPNDGGLFVDKIMELSEEI